MFKLFSLDIEYPDLYSLAKNQEAIGTWVSNRWSPAFRSLLSSQRISLLGDLVSISYLSPTDNRDDICWSLHDSGSFSINSLYKHIAASPSSSFPFMIIWKFKISQLSKDFCLAGRLTSDVLHHRNITQPFSCVFCLHDLETSNHLFINCPTFTPHLGTIEALLRFTRSA